MRLIITRHGETEENVSGRIMGQLLHGKLSSRGHEQARRVAERLRKEKIDIIFSSDLARAADTAKEIAKFHKGVKFKFSKEIREIDFGNIQGMHKYEITDWDIMKNKIYEVNSNPYGGESIIQLFKRAESFLHKLINKYTNDTVLVVCHAIIGKALLLTSTNTPPEEFLTSGKLDNTSISIVEISEDRSHEIHLHNCTQHLV